MKKNLINNILQDAIDKIAELVRLSNIDYAMRRQGEELYDFRKRIELILWGLECKKRENIIKVYGYTWDGLPIINKPRKPISKEMKEFIKSAEKVVVDELENPQIFSNPVPLFSPNDEPLEVGRIEIKFK